MKSYIYKYEAEKQLERLQRKVVWLLPRWVIKWATIRAVSHATTGRWSSTIVPTLPAIEVVKRWDHDNQIKEVQKNDRKG